MDERLLARLRTGEHTVSNIAAVVACRSIRRQNKQERWNREMLLGILGHPWSLQDGRVEVDPNPCCRRFQPSRQRREPGTKSVGIWTQTLGCRGCLVIGQPHTEECRARITARMENDPAHAKRLEDNLNRRNEFANPETATRIRRHWRSFRQFG